MTDRLAFAVVSSTGDALKIVRVLFNPARGSGDTESMFIALRGGDPDECPIVFDWSTFRRSTKDAYPALFELVRRAMRRMSLTRINPGDFELSAAHTLRKLLEKIEAKST